MFFHRRLQPGDGTRESATPQPADYPSKESHGFIPWFVKWSLRQMGNPTGQSKLRSYGNGTCGSLDFLSTDGSNCFWKTKLLGKASTMISRPSFS